MYGCDPKIKKTALILACAGSGKRVGGEVAKQFLNYKGQPLFLQALLAAEASPYVGEILVVTREEALDFVRAACKKAGIQKLVAVLKGGKERQDSIHEGLKAVSKEVDYVYVQDAARPFCKASYFEDCYKVLEEGAKGVVLGIPVKDTIKRVVDGIIVSTPKRAELFAAQTPQAFPRELLLAAYEKAKKEGFLGTDDASLVEALGENIRLIPGEEGNLKITVPEDLERLKD